MLSAAKNWVNRLNIAVAHVTRHLVLKHLKSNNQRFNIGVPTS